MDTPGLKARLCRNCDAEHARLMRLDPYVKELAVSAYRLKNYGITADEYIQMAKGQDYKCAICGNPERVTRRGEVKTLAVDHDHDTGQIRDLLCGRCNTGIGLLGDDPKIIQAALDYLERHGKAA